MADRSPIRPSSFKWWVRDDIELSATQSPRPSAYSEFSSKSERIVVANDIELSATQSPRPSAYSEFSSKSERIVTLSIPGTATPSSPATPFATTAKKSAISGGTTPEIINRIENASPETARNVALRMYKSLKRHGLENEVGSAFARGEDFQDAEEDKGDNADGHDRKNSEELLGMDYLLKDGFVNYLRDMVKITPPIPQQVVRFSGIKYGRKIEVSHVGYETFGNKVVGCFIGPLKSVLRRKNATWSQILKGVDGYIMPGSMTLLLGPPGSGKSTLLRVLAGRVNRNGNCNFEGSVMYNDKYAKDILLSKLIAYISSQLHIHIPYLSVRETLEFARDCTQGLRPENFTPQMRKFFAHALVEGQDPFLEYVLEILSLKQIQDKLVGGEISDIDRQKLTTAELALGTYSVMIYDQPPSGSDLAATYDLVDTIRTISRIQQSSAIMSLTQLSQEVFDLFDRIILLSDGQVLFQGPRQDAIPYFTKLGYIKPSHVESSEFLEDVAAGHGSQYIAPGATPYSLGDLLECYRASDHYKDVIRIVNGSPVKLTYWVKSESGLGLSLKVPSKRHDSEDSWPRRDTELVVAKLSAKIGHFGGIESTGRVQIGDTITAISMNKEEMQYLSVGSPAVQHQRASHVYAMLKQTRAQIRLQVERYKEEDDEKQAEWRQFQRPFVQTWWRSTSTLVHRQIKIMKRLHSLVKLRLLQAIILGIFAGTLFYKLGGQYNQQKMNSIRALGFVSTMSIMLINLVQLPLYMLQRPIFYKHKTQRFFRASSYTTAQSIVNLPQTFAEALAYTLCVYFLAGLSMAGNGMPLFEYLMLLFLVAYFGSQVFFFLSAVSPVPEVGNALAGLLVSIFLLFSGFVIYPSNIPAYWKWLTYINPIHWANVSFCRSQFGEGYADHCSNYIDQLPFCATFPHMTVGKAYLKFYELSGDDNVRWLPYALLLVWIVIVNILTVLGLKFIEFSSVSQSLPRLKKTPKVSKYEEEDREDREGDFSSYNSMNDHSDLQGASQFLKRKNSQPVHDYMKNKVGVEKWINELHIDIEENRLGIPVEPVTLLFEALSFSRIDEGNSRSVFSNVTGFARPRDMLALLGGSRMSRTTLLKCLAGRVPVAGRLNGNLQANGFSMGATFSRLIGYVEKLDAHQPYLSVRESIQFSAALRLGQTISHASRRIHVELVLNQLGLLSYSNQLVGSLFKATGKTLEIAKKITIAVELAANPGVLLLEEPLSGLDSTGTLAILRVLSQISESGRVIIATLTHPSTRTLSFFEKALILMQEGQQAYFGPIGSNCSELISYFMSIPKVPRFSGKESPITFVMGTLGLGIKRRGTASHNFAEIYQASPWQEYNSHEVCRIKKLTEKEARSDESSAYPAPYWCQALVIFLRTQRFMWRNVQYTYSRLTGCIIIGLLMGSLYYQIEYTDTYGATSRSLYIYMQVIIIGVISANNVIPQIGTDRLVYFRERRSKMYVPILYPLSWAVSEIPYFLVATLAVVGIGNGMAGIGTGSAGDFLSYWMALFLFTLCMTYFGMMITFLAPVPTLAAFAVSILTSMWVSASGVVVVLSDIRFYRWMYWSNPFQFAMNAMTSIGFYCDTKDCGTDCRCPKFPDRSYVWDKLAATRSLSYEAIGRDILVLGGICILFSSFAFVFFVILRHNSAPHV